MSGVQNKNNQETKSYRFNEQCYLMKNLDSLSSFNQSTSKEYKNLISIDDGTELLMNKMYGTGFGTLMDLSTPQASLLVPSIRLFKLYPDGKEVEFKFPDHISSIDLDNILLENQRRPNSIGIKKLSWEDLGKQPAQTGLSFRASLELEMNDIADLFKEVEVDGETTYKFADLISYAPTQFLNKGEAEQTINPDYFRIKMIVGWAEPPENELFTKALRDAIRDNQLHLFLNLTTYTLDYQENGQVNVSIDFVGYLEGVMYDPRTDILGYNKKDYAELEKKIEDIERNQETLTEEMNSPINFNFDRQDIQQFEKKLNEQALQNIIEEKRKKLRLERSQLYEKFINDIYDRRKIYYFDLPWEQIKSFAEEEEVKKGGPKPKKQSDAEIQEAKEQVSRKLLADTSRDLEHKYSPINDVTVPKGPNDYRVNFVFLGDILDVALDSFYRQDGTLSSELTQKLDKKDYKFIFGAFQFENPDIPGQMLTIPMVDIPISLNVFIAWWLKNVIDIQRTSLSIKDFFREFLTSVVINSLTLECFGENYRPGMYEIYFNILSFPKFDDEFRAGERVKVDNLDFHKFRKGVYKKSDEYSHYLFCGILGTKVRYDEFPSRAKDHSKGIYWMRVGMDSGLVKKITFSKTQMKYFKEAAIAGSFARGEGDVLKSEPYNAEITLIGNNIFKPGMTIYIDPYSLGFRGSVPRDALRIGGYYKVVKVSNSIGLTNFETKLNAVAELASTGIKPKGTKLSEETRNQIDEVKS